MYYNCSHKNFYFVFFRQKIFEDIQRFINTKDIMKKVVFDLENDRYASIKTFLLLIECTFFCN